MKLEIKGKHGKGTCSRLGVIKIPFIKRNRKQTYGNVAFNFNLINKIYIFKLL